MTVAQPVQPTATSPSQPVREVQRIVLHAVDWQTYEKFLDAVGNRSLRLTYDRGKLEIMAPSWNHEWLKSRMGFLLCLFGGLLRMKVQPGGSTTFRRKDVARGLEPDDCFYIQNADRMLGPNHEVDLTRDPPPDLALEVDIHSSSLDRMGIYAALRVPELWRWEDNRLQVYRLGVDGKYEPCERSLGFPSLPLPEFLRFIEETQALSHSELIEPFRVWVQQQVLPPAPGPADGAS